MASPVYYGQSGVCVSCIISLLSGWWWAVPNSILSLSRHRHVRDQHDVSAVDGPIDRDVVGNAGSDDQSGSRYPTPLLIHPTLSDSTSKHYGKRYRKQAGACHFLARNERFAASRLQCRAACNSPNRATRNTGETQHTHAYISAQLPATDVFT